MKVYDKLLNVQRKNNSLLCIGLDPELEKIPSYFGKNLLSILKFNETIITNTSNFVCAYKINFAFYEQYGVDGFKLLKDTFDIIPQEIVSIADAKRADIANTSRAYAKSIFEYFNADCITLNPFMGYDSLSPFFEYGDKFCFVLALTSNQGANDFQKLKLHNTKPLYMEVIEKVVNWGGKSNIGFVVGATQENEFLEIRNLCPENFLLIPGIGYQGGNLHKILELNKNLPAVFNVSRDIIYCDSTENFTQNLIYKTKKYCELLKL